MRIFLVMILTTAPLILTSCSHAPMESPCISSASLDESPCGHIPVNIAEREPKHRMNA